MDRVVTEVALKDIRPPTPQMKDNELHQWRERIYKALLELADSLDIGGGELIIDHNDIENNGGTDSHATITAHINSSIAHGSGSDIAGKAYVNDRIAEARSELSGLQHGVEVDNPTSGVHGVTGNLVGTTDSQTFTNKIINALENTLANLRHGVEVDNSATAHGVEQVVGASEEQVLTNKSIDASDNILRNLKHGLEVDNPTDNVHGALGEVVGTLNYQTLYNKTIVPPVSIISEDTDLGIGQELVFVDTAGVTLTLHEPQQSIGAKVVIDNQSGGDIYVVCSGAEGSYTIEGETTQTIPDDSCMQAMSDGEEWRIV